MTALPPECYSCCWYYCYYSCYSLYHHNTIIPPTTELSALYAIVLLGRIGTNTRQKTAQIREQFRLLPSSCLPFLPFDNRFLPSGCTHATRKSPRRQTSCCINTPKCGREPLKLPLFKRRFSPSSEGIVYCVYRFNRTVIDW